MRTAWRECDRGQMLARNPCIHAGSAEPFDGYHATSRQRKSMEKACFPQISLVFVPILPIFARFYPVSEALTGQAGLQTPSARGGETAAEANYFRPKSTFLRGSNVAAMGVFSASTTGAASRKCRISVAAKSASNAVEAGSVVASP